MDYLEYLSLFSNQGEYEVQVHFKDHDGCVANSSMTASEINNLVDHSTGVFHDKMSFDDHLYDVYKYEIDPVKMVLVIKARRTE